MKNILLPVMIGIFSFARAAAQPEVSADVILTETLKERDEVPFTSPVLSWEDFKGKPDNSGWTAMTYSGIKLRYDYKHNNGRYHVNILLYPYMDKTRSWYTEAGHNNYTLAHEQRHFDITILIARQLAQELRQADYSPKTIAKQINSLHEAYLSKLRQMQNDYDEETRHGINKLQQRIWDRKIETELRKRESAN